MKSSSSTSSAPASATTQRKMSSCPIKPRARVEFPFKIASSYFRFTSKALDGSPFPWPVSDSNKIYNPLSILPDKFHRRVLWYVHSLYQVAYTLFLYVSLSRHAKEYVENSQFVAAVLHITWCLGHSVISTIRIHQLRCNHEMHTAFNQIYKFAARATEKDPVFTATFLKRWRIYDKASVILFLVVIFGSISYAGFVVVFPLHKRYWYLLVLPGNFQINWVVLLFLFVIECAYVSSQWATFCAENFLSIWVIDTMGTTLRLLNKKKADPAVPILELTKMFREVQILNTFYQEAFSGPFGVPGFKFLITVTGLACVSVGIRLSTDVHPIITMFLVIASFACVVVLGLLLPLSAEVYENTAEFGFPNFAYAESQTHARPIAKRIAESCKPFAIRIGALYYIHGGTTLTFLSLFLGSLINILIGMSFYSIK